MTKSKQSLSEAYKTVQKSLHRPFMIRGSWQLWRVPFDDLLFRSELRFIVENRRGSQSCTSCGCCGSGRSGCCCGGGSSCGGWWVTDVDSDQGGGVFALGIDDHLDSVLVQSASPHSFDDRKQPRLGVDLKGHTLSVSVPHGPSDQLAIVRQTSDLWRVRDGH